MNPICVLIRFVMWYMSSLQAKGTKSTSFLTCVRNEVDLVPLACEDDVHVCMKFLCRCAFAAVLGRRRARRVSKLVLISGGAPIPLAPQPGVFSLPNCCLSCFKSCIFSSFER